MTHPTRGRARFGVLVPFTNTNLEPDMNLLAPLGVSMHFARLGGYDVDEIPDVDQMAGLGASDISEELRLLSGARPDVVLYGCTSATLSHGPAFDRDLAATIHKRMGAETVTAAGALVHALRACGASRIAFASPYVASLNDAAIAFLAAEGFKTVARADYPVALGNYGQGELTPAEVTAHALKADHPDAEALVLSCTDMRSVEATSELEELTGKPIICSNRAIVDLACKKIGL
ncbi:MAG: Asp/Glu racemase [Paracoccaceae bacterium]